MFLKQTLKKCGTSILGFAGIGFVVFSGKAVFDGSTTLITFWTSVMAYLSFHAINLMVFVLDIDPLNTISEFYKDLTYVEKSFEPKEGDITISKIDGLDQYSATKFGTRVVGVGPTKEKAVEDFENTFREETNTHEKISPPKRRGWVFDTYEETFKRKSSLNHH